MMPRPVLRDYFHLTYRKIPVLAIGKDVYCDTSIILEALEQAFPDTQRSLYPRAADGRDNRAIIRGFQSYWTDRPLFRVATGLLPSVVWRTRFGQDRAGLIGHPLDPDKLEAKIPRNLAHLDLHLSLIEPQLASGGWLFQTETPSLADISLYYQLDWARTFSAGNGISNLTAGDAADTNEDVIGSVFNGQRYPIIWTWFHRFWQYINNLPSTETRVAENAEKVIRQHLQISSLATESTLLSTPAVPLEALDVRLGLRRGAEVTIAPDDTGQNDPTRGFLEDASPEEVVVKPVESADVRLHFPRLGFVINPVKSSKL
ncbi:MAG: hypothetical protein Q9159_003698 [Coniocarpon cinnabarinum]